MQYNRSSADLEFVEKALNLSLQAKRGNQGV
jgi:hypothetical protein